MEEVVDEDPESETTAHTSSTSMHASGIRRVRNLVRVEKTPELPPPDPPAITQAHLSTNTSSAAAVVAADGGADDSAAEALVQWTAPANSMKQYLDIYDKTQRGDETPCQLMIRFWRAYHLESARRGVNYHVLAFGEYGEHLSELAGNTLRACWMMICGSRIF